LGPVKIELNALRIDLLFFDLLRLLYLPYLGIVRRSLLVTHLLVGAALPLLGLFDLGVFLVE
jgi:hypothetical protein